MKVIILGSCVTRDAFEELKDSNVELVEYFARSSLGALYAEPLVGADLSSIESNFQKRIVSHDLSKEFKRYIEGVAFDCLVYDPIDERFDILDYGDGVRVTLSNESSKVLDQKLARVIKSGSDEFFSLWEEGWSKVYASFCKTGTGKLFINNVKWASTRESGLGFESTYSQSGIDKANGFLDRIYNRIKQDVDASCFIHKGSQCFIAKDEHKWGVSPFHYVDRIYRAVADKLIGLSKEKVDVEGGAASEVVSAKVEVSLNGSAVDARILVSNPRQGDLFYFYFCRNGRVQERSLVWSDQTTASFEINESGSYFIQGYIRRKDKKKIIYSDTFTFLTEEDRRKVKKSIEREQATAVYPAGKVFRREYPYSDYLVYSWNSLSPAPEISGLQGLLEDNSLRAEVCNKNRWVVLCDHEDGYDISAVDNSVFTGSFFDDEDLIFGVDDFSNNSGDLHVEDKLGNYTYIQFGEKNDYANVYTDYFGHSKVYYYQGEKGGCVTNNYHLLLLFLKGVGVDLSINKDKLLSSFCFTGLQIFSQNYSPFMDVSPVFLLPSNKRVFLRDGGIFFKDKEVGGSVVGYGYDKKSYHDLIGEAKADIIKNVGAVLKHPRFDNVMVDLSGGLDSRLVFSALTNIKGYYNKVRLNSYEVQSQPEDLIIALKIASLYSYRFDDLERNTSSLDEEELPVTYWSYTLGSYYSAVPLNSKSVLSGAARLTGAYGETCARPYYAARFFGTDLDVTETREFCDLYIDRFRKDALDGSSVNLNVVKDSMFQALDSVPGNTALEKLENHYLFYRNELHLSDQLRSQTSCPEFGPIQSKFLHRAKMMAFNRFKDSRVQHELMARLNPVLASLPYEKDTETRFFQSLANDVGGFIPTWLNGLDVRADYESARKERMESRKGIKFLPEDDGEASKLQRLNKIFKERSFEEAIVALRFLHDKEVFTLGLTETIFYNLMLNDEYGDYKKWTLVNRVMSAYIQCLIVYVFSVD